MATTVNMQLPTGLTKADALKTVRQYKSGAKLKTAAKLKTFGFKYDPKSGVATWKGE